MFLQRLYKNIPFGFLVVLTVSLKDFFLTHLEDINAVATYLHNCWLSCDVIEIVKKQALCRGPSNIEIGTFF